MDNQQKTIKLLLESRKDAVSAIQKKIDDNEATIEVTSTNVAVLLQDIESLKSSIADRQDVLENVTKAKAISSKKENKLTHLTETVEFFNGNEVCPQCDQGIPHEHKSNIIAVIQREMGENQKNIEDLESALGKLNDRLTQISEIQDKISDKNIELSTANQTITLLNKMNRELAQDIENQEVIL
jgi:peptidoglycan hydrolase CwlO-like protein